MEEDLDEEDIDPFRHCGEYFDKETNKLYLRTRYYDPFTGRFATEDLIRAGLNFYSYCSNNPIAFIDPLGLKEVPLRKYAEGFGAYVYWTAEKTIILHDGRRHEVIPNKKNFRNGVMYADDSELNRVFGWGTTTVVSGGYGTVRITNAPNGKNIELKNGWSYRYDIDQSGGKNHMHLFYKNSQDYSQNDDGSNHHDPKGGSGPPKKYKSFLKKKLDGIGKESQK